MNTPKIDPRNFRKDEQINRVGNEMCYFLRKMRRSLSGPQGLARSFARKVAAGWALMWLAGIVVSRSAEQPALRSAAPKAGEISYTNIVDRSGPWSIHVVKWPRRSAFELLSVHATGRGTAR